MKTFFTLTLALLLASVTALWDSSPATASLDESIVGRATTVTVQIGNVADRSDGTWIWSTVGSGTIISPDGLILTNSHVIHPSKDFGGLPQEWVDEGYEPNWEVFTVSISNGTVSPELRYFAEVAADDPALDVAVLRIVENNYRVPINGSALNLPAVEIGQSQTLNLGHEVHVFGYPAIGGGSLTYTTGIVSGFLYEVGTDGPAWITTDAVISGGNSGGGAYNINGQLIGIPTQGLPLDCRPGDTNLDGVFDEQDVGCRATGGSIEQLRPIDLAMPLINSVDPTIAQQDPPAAVVAAAPTAAPAAPTAAAAPQPTEVAEAPTAAPAAPTATAVMANVDPLIEGQACAERGDWRCAAKFLSLAVEAGNTDVRDQAYDAWLRVADLDLDSGQISAARDAYATATALNPGRPEAAERAAPLADLLAVQSVDGFAGSQVYGTGTQGSVSLAYVDGALTFSFADGSLWSYPIGETSLPSTPIAIIADIRDVSGGASVVIEALSPETSWSFAVDPTNKLVAISSKDAASGALYPWQPAVSFAEVVPGSIQRVEVRLRDRVPTLWINGVDVTAALGITPMAIGPEMSAQFGAMGNPAGGSASVALERISIADIR